jgi:hypothetical protein
MNTNIITSLASTSNRRNSSISFWAVKFVCKTMCCSCYTNGNTEIVIISVTFGK